MRVAVDMHFLQDKHQGIKTFLVGLYGSLVKMQSKHEFVYIFPREDDTSEYWRKHGDVIITGEMSRGARLSYGMANAIRRSGKVDVSHFNAVAPFGVPGKLLLSVHDILYKTHPKYFSSSFRIAQNIAMAWNVRRANSFAVGSAYTLSVLQKLYPSTSQRLHLLRNGVDLRFYSRIDGERAARAVKIKYGLDKYILSVGRVDPRKNYLNMLQAYLAVRQSVSECEAVRFVIVGEIDNSYYEVSRFLEKLRADGNVIWLRNVDENSLRELYAASLFVAFASHAEGFGLPIIEAMAAGVPVIAGNNTAMPEVLEDCGILVQSNDVNRIADAYASLLSDAGLRNRLGGSGRARAMSFGWDSSAIRYLEILEDLK